MACPWRRVRTAAAGCSSRPARRRAAARLARRCSSESAPCSGRRSAATLEPACGYLRATRSQKRDYPLIVSGPGNVSAINTNPGTVHYLDMMCASVSWFEHKTCVPITRAKTLR